MTTITQVRPNKNLKVHRTSPRPSPSPLDLGIRGFRHPHLTVTVIVTTLLGDRGLVRYNNNYHRRVMSPGINHVRTLTVDNTITVRDVRTRVRGPSLQVHNYYHLHHSYRGPGIYHRRSPVQTHKLRTHPPGKDVLSHTSLNDTIHSFLLRVLILCYTPTTIVTDVTPGRRSFPFQLESPSSIHIH